MGVVFFVLFPRAARFFSGFPRREAWWGMPWPGSARTTGAPSPQTSPRLGKLREKKKNGGQLGFKNNQEINHHLTVLGNFFFIATAPRVVKTRLQILVLGKRQAIYSVPIFGWTCRGFVSNHAKAGAPHFRIELRGPPPDRLCWF